MKTFGSYFLIDSVGTGGMAEVFVAAVIEAHKRERLPPLVAIKKIRSEFSNQKAFVDRFVAEAKLGALLKHENIVRIYDLGIVGTDVYFAMDWVDGKSLDHVYSKLKSIGTKLAERHVLYIFHQLIEGLYVAHNALDSARRPLGIVHRDITPGNILVGYDGTIKLTDFGLATAEASARGQAKEAAFGKLPYMPPEQIKNEKVDQRSDIFAFAVLLIEALTGERPFSGKNQHELQQKILESEPILTHPALADKLELVPLLKRALSKNPQDRPKSIAEFKSVIPMPDPAQGKVDLSELMKSVFEETRTEEKAKVKEGLLQWDELVRKGADLEPDEVFVQDLLSGPDAPVAEKTEFLPAPQAAQATRIAFKSGSSNTSVGKIEIQRKVVERTIERPDVVEEVVVQTDPRMQVPEELIELANEPSSLPPPSEWVESTSSPEEEIEHRPALHHPPKKEIQWKAWISGVAILLVLFSVAMSIAFRNISAHSTLKSFLPIKQLQYYVTIETVSDDVWGDESPRNRFWFQPVVDFLSQEHQRFTGQKELPFEIGTAGLKTKIREVDWKGSLLSPMGPFGELSDLFKVNLKEAAADRVTVFIHVYPKKYEETPKYPIDFQSERPPRTGIAFIPLSPKEDQESLVRLAHETLHALGASDKYNDKGEPKFPDGYAEPKKSPLYPQSQGEIMSRAIFISENNFRPLKSLKEARIGEKTAYEIGWVSGRLDLAR